jgi:hypothetical protein
MRSWVGRFAVAAICGLFLLAPMGEISGDAAIPGANAATETRSVRGAARDAVVVRDRAIQTVYALDGRLVYSRGTRRQTWIRVLHGHRLLMRGMPAGSGPFSIGRDRRGRIVVVMAKPSGLGLEVKSWWLYDVVRDAARRLHIRARPGCAVASGVAVWRGRTAYTEQCRGSTWGVRVMLRQNGHTRWLAQVGTLEGGATRLFVRGSSLAAEGGDGLEAQAVWRVLDRGRLCKRAGAPWLGSIDRVGEEYGMWVGLDPRTLIWATAASDFSSAFFGLTVKYLDLTGRCRRPPLVRAISPSSLPATPIKDVAIDGRTLYYATDTAIHRLRLPTGR